MNIKQLKTTLEKFSPDTILVNAPHKPHSYRGYYEQLSFERSGEDATVGEFLALLESCIGKSFTGYKGGEFVMNLDTIVNIADYGNTGGEIEGVYCDEDGVFLSAFATSARSW